MNKIKKEWNSRSVYSKILLILSFIVSIVILVICILSLFNVVENAGSIYVPLLSCLMIIQGLDNIKRDKISSIISFSVGMLILLIYLISLF